MNCVLKGRDSIVVLPTGGGKSLCFQAPATILPGLAVVISPLISLMKDQVDALTECGVPAARLDSSLSYQEQAGIVNRVRQGRLKLLYLSPERLVTPRFMEILKSVDLSFAAVDEAHCVSMWGHDFRPEYRQLAALKEVFPRVAVHAFTATATDQVREDIARQLNLDSPEILVGSFDRPNLVYKARRRHNLMTQIMKIVERHRDESGIIYCIRRADVEKMAVELSARGLRVLPYHAGLADTVRKSNQDAFIKEKVDIIVATVAFGMGIDKSNVRYVVHAGMPKSLEHYQQESGRAGRDGLEAECILLYSGADYGIWLNIIGEMDPEPGQIASAKLNDMYHYATGITCRHKALVNYFGQEFEHTCQACDICLGQFDCLEDSLITSQKILSCIMRLKEKFGGDYTALVLNGSKEQRIITNRHDELSTYGLLSDYKKPVIRDWIEQLVAQGYARKSSEYNILSVTPSGWRVLKGLDTPKLLKPVKSKDRSPVKGKTGRLPLSGADEGLFQTLRKLRREIAEKKNVAAFIVFGDAALRDMAIKKPSSQDSFLEVKGVGERKSQEYGDTFIKAIVDYCRAHSLETDVLD